MEIMNGVHQIPVNYKNRPLQLYLLLGPEIAMLMDCGDAAVPDSDILPYFEKIGFDPKKLTHVMATHPDVDHTGGCTGCGKRRRRRSLFAGLWIASKLSRRKDLRIFACGRIITGIRWAWMMRRWRSL